MMEAAYQNINAIRTANTPGNNAALIHIQGLSKGFGERQVLRGFSLEVKRGEAVIVLGKSGSGKSVLIKCLVGLVQPDAGSVQIFNREVLSMDYEEIDKVRSRIGFLFQQNALYDSLTVRQNLEFLFNRRGIVYPESEMNDMVRNALEDVGLAHTADMMPAELSGGMRKRVALARCLITRPEVMLYDEPTTGLDPITSREIEDLMASVQEKYSMTSIIISHDMSCVKRFGDHVVMLIDGVCYAEGRLEMLQQSDDPKIKAFFQE